MPFTDQVVCVSEDSRRYYVGRGVVKPAKCSVIVNGISLDVYRHRKAMPRKGAGLRFGTVGRLERVKDHAVLLEAFAIFLRRYRDASLQIVGGGSLEASLTQLAARLGISERVALLGPTNDVPGFLEGLDVFVLSSQSEGLPLVILEAMAAGLPIVSTRVGGVPEVAPEGSVAWYSPPGDAAALGESLHEAAVSQDLAARGEVARRIAFERYDLEKMRQNYDALIRRILTLKNVKSEYL